MNKAHTRKLHALEEVKDNNLIDLDLLIGNPIRRKIEEKHKVKILIERGYCVSVWTQRTPIIKYFK